MYAADANREEIHDRGGATAQLIAAKGGSARAVAQLVRQGASRERRDEFGRTAAQYAQNNTLNQRQF